METNHGITEIIQAIQATAGSDRQVQLINNHGSVSIQVFDPATGPDTTATAGTITYLGTFDTDSSEPDFDLDHTRLTGSLFDLDPSDPGPIGPGHVDFHHVRPTPAAFVRLYQVLHATADLDPA